MLEFSRSGRPATARPPVRVREIMTPDVLTLAPDQTFREAVAMMANRPFRHFLVVHGDNQLAGVLSDRDLLRVLGRRADWDKLTVGEVMTTDVKSVEPDTPLSEAARKMLTHRINCLAVLDESRKVVGIVTSTDLLYSFLRLQSSLERVTRSPV